jgi:hypothetical protein
MPAKPPDKPKRRKRSTTTETKWAVSQGGGELTQTDPLGYDAQALTITAVRHVFIVIADLLAAISTAGLFGVLYFLFQGARAGAAAETERRRP